MMRLRRDTIKSDEMKSGKIVLKPHKRSKKNKKDRKVGQEHQQGH